MSFALGVLVLMLVFAPQTAWAHGDHAHEPNVHIDAGQPQATSAWPAPCPGGSEVDCGCRSAGVGKKHALVAISAAVLRVSLARSRAPAMRNAPPALPFSFAFQTRAPPRSS